MRNEKSAPPVVPPPDDAAVAEREPEVGQTPAPAAPVKGAAEEQPAFDPLHSPQGSALAAWGKEDKPAVHSGESRAKTEAAPPREEQFNWLFQMAAFRDKADAERVRGSLEKAGYRAVLVRDGKMFLVHLRLRGGETEVARLREQARRLRLGAPLTQSRTPVAEKKAKR
jgi:cell division septation protein DedD